MKRIFIILTTIACLCSCEKQEQPHWLHNIWSGTYDITMTNNDTEESEPHFAIITLQFSDDRSECVLEKGVQGLFAITRKTYRAYLNEQEKTFVLNEGDHDSRLLYMGSVKSDGTLTLTWYTEKDIISAELKSDLYFMSSGGKHILPESAIRYR